MVDIAFEPDAIEAIGGETVRFVFRNSGDVAHDAFIGDADAQEEHDASVEDAHGGHGEDAEDELTLDPGASGELVHTFDQAGEILIGRHQPGHDEDGMRITVDVS